MTAKQKPLSEAAITLPWPHKGLSPNARLHWAAKAKLVKAAREQAGWTMLASMGIGSWGWAAAKLVRSMHMGRDRQRELIAFITKTAQLMEGK